MVKARDKKFGLLIRAHSKLAGRTILKICAKCYSFLTGNARYMAIRHGVGQPLKELHSLQEVLRAAISLGLSCELRGVQNEKKQRGKAILKAKKVKGLHLPVYKRGIASLKQAWTPE
eukprot:scaffold116534_cov21-Tisochrysis_lutea.AAC.1